VATTVAMVVAYTVLAIVVQDIAMTSYQRRHNYGGRTMKHHELKAYNWCCVATMRHLRLQQLLSTACAVLTAVCGVRTMPVILASHQVSRLTVISVLVHMCTSSVQQLRTLNVYLVLYKVSSSSTELYYRCSNLLAAGALQQA
jgi:hypothetical protein